MISRPLAIGLLAAGCLTAAAGGSYLAVRQNATAVPAAPVTQPAPAMPAVNETEAVITPEKPRIETPAPEPPIEVAPPAPTPRVERKLAPRARPIHRPAPVRAAEAIPSRAPDLGPVTPAPVAVPVSAGGSPSAGLDSTAPAAVPAEPVSRSPEPVFEEIVLPASSVVGLELETTVTTERARVEDRVDARVTRDVYADGRLAIPAGSRVIGLVTEVERGGKVKERARLGVRFHTLVLGSGRQVALRTETIYREGESPSGESSRKIGGAAIGGAVLGAIIGGGKGAIAGATAGAAGGTAAVMAGGRNPATLASGSIVTVKLSTPATFEIER